MSVKKKNGPDSAVDGNGNPDTENGGNANSTASGSGSDAIADLAEKTTGKKKADKKGVKPKDAPDTSTDEKKKEALLNAIAGIEKAFGKGSVMKMGEWRHDNIPVVTTGCLSLDVALGVGGLPKGRIIEIYGPESSGKTTVALHVVAEVQKLNGVAGYVDAEHALDPIYAKKLGVNIDELYISQPDDGEQALEIAEAMVRSGAIEIVVIDSVAALVPRAEIEGLMGASHVGAQARLMSQALRKLAGITNKTNCIVIFINQLREKIGVTYGNPETTTGGRALKFYSSVRIDIRKDQSIKQGDNFVGNHTRVKIAKNKVAPPFKTAEFDIMFGLGISKEGDILDLAVTHDLIQKSGTWYSYNEGRLGQGRENSKDYLRENPEICHALENSVRNKLGLKELEDLALPDNYVETPPDLAQAEVEITDEDMAIEELLVDMENDPTLGQELEW